MPWAYTCLLQVHAHKRDESCVAGPSTPPLHSGVYSDTPPASDGRCLELKAAPLPLPPDLGATGQPPTPAVEAPAVRPSLPASCSPQQCPVALCPVHPMQSSCVPCAVHRRLSEAQLSWQLATLPLAIQAHLSTPPQEVGSRHHGAPTCGCARHHAAEPPSSPWLSVAFTQPSHRRCSAPAGGRGAKREALLPQGPLSAEPWRRVAACR